jgi:hypothetical protein
VLPGTAAAAVCPEALYEGTNTSDEHLLLVEFENPERLVEQPGTQENIIGLAGVVTLAILHLRVQA